MGSLELAKRLAAAAAAAPGTTSPRGTDQEPVEDGEADRGPYRRPRIARRGNVVVQVQCAAGGEGDAVAERKQRPSHRERHVPGGQPQQPALVYEGMSDTAATLAQQQPPVDSLWRP